MIESRTRLVHPSKPLVLADFRNAHLGETIVVCGCGESLKELRDPERYITIGVNDAGRLFDPHYLVVVNPRTQFTGDRFQHVAQSNARVLFTQLDLGQVRPPVVRFKLGPYGGTEISTDVLPHTQNSPYVAVCLAAYMGARQIGLIGVDLTDHHFFARTGRHPLAGRLREIDLQYGQLAAALRRRDMSLVNLSATSRLTSLPKLQLESFPASIQAAPARSNPPTSSLQIVSYATTPVAGVPAILARCIAGATGHAARCVWATDRYGNGVSFAGDVQWNQAPREAIALIESADVVIVHNGKVAPPHARLLENKPVVTMAHNYGWNVDTRFVRRGQPGVVVGQYQATLPEFAGWSVVPNPIPLWEPGYQPGAKTNQITIAFTPSAPHERYASGHRLQWHAKGFATTMRVLERLARDSAVHVEVTGTSTVPHAQALDMKRRAHVVIDECVTGSYHRNSLEGLATGCVVVNGVGLLPGVAEVLRRCAPGTTALPFVFATLETLERVLRQLLERGADQLVDAGRSSRAWMEQHWQFGQQWERCWAPVLPPSVARHAARPLTSPRRPSPTRRPQEVKMNGPDNHTVSVIIPHGGTDRLPQLRAALATLRQRPGVGELIVVEMGAVPVADAVAGRWADKHLFIRHSGAFERARALNAGVAVAEHDFVLWHDNDLLIPPALIRNGVKELCDRRLDFLMPYTSIRYLSEADSCAVAQGICNPNQCRPVNTLYAAGRHAACPGCLGLVRRDFLLKHGGYIEGFRGWGGEDNAWLRKATLLGRSAATQLTDQHVFHLYHPTSGGYVPAVASASNPYYAENVALLQRVWAVRDAGEFMRTFPAPSPTTGALTRFAKGSVASARDDELPVWSYWEGPCPAWILACRQTLTAHAPRIRLLTPQHFDRLHDEDRDINLSRLDPPHRADYVRAFLLRRYGGFWVDADCLLMQSLSPLLELLTTHEFIGHRERSGLISNAFVGARPGSRIAAKWYDHVCKHLRSGKAVHWTTLGGEALTPIVTADPHGWHELPCERVQPVCWSHPEEFFVEQASQEHERRFDPEAICYMLSNQSIQKYARQHARAELLRDRTFFTFLHYRALGAAPAAARPGREHTFARHGELYRQLGGESVSGPGSSLSQTQLLRERLPLVLEDLTVCSLLDAPCGDFHWMRHMRLGRIEYVGVDILGEVITQNRWLHGTAHHAFVQADIVNDVLPRADAVLCRDLLTHLSFEEIREVLTNFRRSGAKYLMTTTFTTPRANQDTSGGAWRPLNLQLPPFRFPAPLRLINEACTENGGIYSDKSIGVWLLQELPL